MKVVVSMGSAYNLTNRAYINLLTDLANDNAIYLDNYGKYLGPVMNITDMSAEEAQDALDEEK